MNTTERQCRAWFLAGLFLLCMCGLMLQVIETRVLSVISQYHLAFFAISMAMFGMTSGSLFVYFRQALFPAERLFEHLVWICGAFAVAIVLSTMLLISTVVVEGGKSDLLVMALLWSKVIVVLAIPYVFAGMAISLALTRSPWPVPLAYGVDLMGAASGCLGVLAVLAILDAISALFLVGAFAAAGAACFQAANRALGSQARPLLIIARSRILTHPVLLAAGIAALAVGNATIQPYGLKLSIVKGRVEAPNADTIIRWNSFSRIDVAPSQEGPPLMWSPSSTATLPTIEQRYMAIDGMAGTAIYKFDDTAKLDFLKDDLTALAYYIRHRGRAAIIGVGGGRDIATAKVFGFGDVTGVELNPIVVDLLERQLSSYDRVASLPGVTLHVDEARSWFARSDEHFDLIQMSMIDTWAATGAGAFSLSENGLYTVEGWRTFFDHLTPAGILTVSRWYSPTILNETGRMVSLAVATLIKEGVANPRDHIFAASNGNLATLIVSRAPLSAADLATLNATVSRLQYQVLVGTDGETASPELAEIVGARSIGSLDALAATYHLDVSPPTDDHPFFFNQLRLMDPSAWYLAMKSPQGVMRGNLLATITLAIIIALSSALALATMIVPSLPSLRRVTRTFAAFGTIYFLLIGLGFMFVEIGLIQRICVYLGHPVYGLSIGLFGLILSTSLGSLAVSRFNLVAVPRLLGWSLALALYLAILPAWFAVLVHHYAAASLVVRSAVSLLAVVPSGFLMGFGFPTGMAIANSIDSRATPWFWAVNGAAGVLAAGLAVAVSIQLSISAAVWLGAACYFMLGPTAVALVSLRVRGMAEAIRQAD